MDIDPNDTSNLYAVSSSATTTFPPVQVAAATTIGNYYPGGTGTFPPVTQIGNVALTNASTFVQTHQQQQLPLMFGLIIPGCPVRTDFIPIHDSIATNPTLQQVLVPPTKLSMNVSCKTDLNNIPLLSITELILFTTSSSTPMPYPTPPSPIIPPDYGVLCYWQISEQSPQQAPLLTPAAPTMTTSTGFALFGALTNTQPSAIYRTGWSEHEQLVNMVQKSNNNNNLILTIGLSIEPIQNVQNLLGTSGNGSITTTSPTKSPVLSPTNASTATTNSRLFVAQQIALDLYHFMQSFDATTATTTNTMSNSSTTNASIMMVPTNIFDRWYQRFENRYRRDPNFFLQK